MIEEPIFEIHSISFFFFHISVPYKLLNLNNQTNQSLEQKSRRHSIQVMLKEPNENIVININIINVEKIVFSHSLFSLFYRLIKLRGRGER